MLYYRQVNEFNRENAADYIRIWELHRQAGSH